MKLLFELIGVLSPKLESLILSQVFIDDGAAECLAAALICNCKNLKHITLSDCKLSNKAIGDICTAIVRSQSIESIDLKDSHLGSHYLTR